MTEPGTSEKPRLRPKEIRASAIVRTLVRFVSFSTIHLSALTSCRYYSAKPGSSATSNHDPPEGALCIHSHSSSSSLSTCDSNLATLQALPLVEFPEDTSFTSLVHDQTLTAFAQLGAFRLDVPRAVITLIDHEYQFVIAEATRSVSLQDPKKANPGDELWVGSVRLPAKWAICPDTIHTFNCDDGSLNQSTANITANQRCYIVNDLAATDTFKDEPYVTGPPFMRFYAEIPLKTNSGYVIGSYRVFDSKPRAGLDPESLDRLSEVA